MTPEERHLRWLDGRLPSVALEEDYARNVEDSPLGRWLAARDSRSSWRRGGRKPKRKGS